MVVVVEESIVDGENTEKEDLGAVFRVRATICQIARKKGCAPGQELSCVAQKGLARPGGSTDQTKLASVLLYLYVVP